MAVSGALGLDVTCGCDEPLQDEGSAALRRGLEGRGGPDLVVVVQDGDAASAATVGALQGHRVAVGGGEGDDGLGVGDRVGDAGTGATWARSAVARALILSPRASMASGEGPTQVIPAS